MARKTVSVVIPTYNRIGLLRDMLEALSRQTLPADLFEVVVVVDGSTDGTWEMLQELRTPYNLRSIYQDNAGDNTNLFSSGVSVARNNGAQAGQGDVIVFMDDDLLPEPSLLESRRNIHLEDSNALVLGMFLPSDEDHVKKGWHYWEERVLAKHYQDMVSGKRPPNGWRLYSGNFSVGRANFLDAGGFDVRMGNVRGEDVELGLRLEARGLRFYHSPGAGAVHRGYRTFGSWRNSAYILGPRDIFLAKEKNFQHVLEGVGASYNRRSWLFRKALHTFVENRAVREAMVDGLKRVSGVLGFFKARKLASYGYSVIFKFEYWRGAIDEMGGTRAFETFANQVSQDVRTYEFVKPGDSAEQAADQV